MTDLRAEAERIAKGKAGACPARDIWLVREGMRAALDVAMEECDFPVIGGTAAEHDGFVQGRNNCLERIRKLREGLE